MIGRPSLANASAESAWSAVELCQEDSLLLTDDHLSVRAFEGQVWAASKTEYPSTDAGLYARYLEGATYMVLGNPSLAAGSYQQVIDKAGNRIYEVPISYTGREFWEGKKISWKDAFVVVRTLIKYRLVD